MKTFFTKIPLVIASALFSISASANQIVATSSPNLVIPDGDAIGLADSINLSTSINSISDVSVTLNVSDGYNGDFYAYLRHSDSSGTAFSVLLNRVGVSAADYFGSSDSGFNIRLKDAVAVNVHDAAAGGAALNGTFRPD